MSPHSGHPLLRDDGAPPERDNNPHKLARIYVERHCLDGERRPTVHYWSGRWWQYEAGAYRPVDDDAMTVALTRAVKIEYDTRPVTDITGHVEPVTRGLVSNVEHSLRSLSGIHLSSSVVQPAWLGATCPRWVNFLGWMFGDDDDTIAFIQEWFGYCLVMDTSQQKFLMLEGPGANGKSVLLATLEALVGEDNCSSVGLEDFGERFALSTTI